MLSHSFFFFIVIDESRHKKLYLKEKIDKKLQQTSFANRQIFSTTYFLIEKLHKNVEKLPKFP